MARILLGLLIIVFAHGQSYGYGRFLGKKTIKKQVDEICIRKILCCETVNFHMNTNFEKKNQILDKLNEISSELKSFLNKTEIKFNMLLNTTLPNSQVSISLQPLKSKLIHCFEIVKEYCHNAVNYDSNKNTFTVNALPNYTQLVLSTVENLLAILQEVHELFNYQHRRQYLLVSWLCETQNLSINNSKHISAQQEMFYTFDLLIVTESMGLSVLNKMCTIKQMLDEGHHYYTNELIRAIKQCQIRLRKYKSIKSRYLSRFPRKIHCYDEQLPKRDINFIELEGFVRAKLWHKTTLLSRVEQHGENSKCGQCWLRCDLICQNSSGIIDDKRVSNCHYLGGPVKVCHAKKDSHREYLWWKIDRVTYGHDETCNDEDDTPVTHFGSSHVNNDMCTCSTYSNNSKPTDIRKYINLSPQLSDIENNKIVTGIKFVLNDEIISFQIQETEFLPGGISNGTGSWKNVSNSTHRSLIDYNRRSIYLDDILVPYGYVVTGVKFDIAENPPGFQLRVHATIFNIATRKLAINSGRWIEPKEFDIPKHVDYNRPRIEITMGDADDPTRSTGFMDDLGTNKYIMFTHTSIHKDAGQTTIPLIETLPVETMPRFPLDGIGIFFKGKDGFGGYIALQIFTIDVSELI